MLATGRSRANAERERRYRPGEATTHHGANGLIGLVLVFGGGLALVNYFFGRRIGGAGGGSEKNIVGVIWLVAAIALALALAYG